MAHSIEVCAEWHRLAPGQVEGGSGLTSLHNRCAHLGAGIFMAVPQIPIKYSTHTCWVDEQITKTNWRSAVGKVQNA